MTWRSVSEAEAAPTGVESPNVVRRAIWDCLDPLVPAAGSPSASSVLAKGDIVSIGGAGSDHAIVFVLDGLVGTRLSTDHDRHLVVDVAAAGEALGIGSLLGRTTDALAVVALTTSTIVGLPLDQLRAVSLEPVAERLADLHARLQHAEAHRYGRLLLDATYRSAEHRVLGRLLELADLVPVDPTDATTRVSVTQDDLATISGVSRQTTNRVLHRAAALGAVRIVWSGMVIDDRDTLAALVTSPAPLI